MKNIISDINNGQGGIESWLDEAKDQIRVLEYKVDKNTQSEQQKKKKTIKKNEGSLRSHWEKLKHINICIIKLPDVEQGEQRIENLFEEIMTKKFPHKVKKNNT